MTSLRPLIAGNWKMNGLRADGVALGTALAVRMRAADKAAFEMLVCPPATLLGAVGEAIAGSGIVLGGQDCHPAKSGAHTGDVAAEMLADIGCRYVIVGHSERRHDHGEPDELVYQKAGAVHRAGLTAIVCVGETAKQRDAGATIAVVGRQLVGSLPEGTTAANTVVAYEPVWAIGTGRTPTSEDVALVHASIRRSLRERFAGGESIRILYGGSVKPSNAADLLAVPDVNGALVGGASLSADDFWGIARSCG